LRLEFHDEAGLSDEDERQQNGGVKSMSHGHDASLGGIGRNRQGRRFAGNFIEGPEQALTRVTARTSSISVSDGEPMVREVAFALG